MRKIILIAAVLLLAACNDTQVVTTYKYMVVHPDEAMYYCPVLKQWPRWNTLKDSEVARLIVELHKNNITCKTSIEGIRTFLKQSDAKIKGG